MFSRIAPALATIPLILGVSAPSTATSQPEIPFGEAFLYFELNNTDSDLGIHSSIDGGPWKTLTIKDTRDRTILSIGTSGRLRKQGLTQLFFESAEPNFDDLDPADFFARFPAGTYDVEARTLDGQEMESEVVVSHLLPGPPANLRVNGLPAGEDCDDVANIPTVTPPVVITWDPVTQSHPELGEQGPVTVNRYQVFAEQRVSGGLKYSLDLPPTVTQYTVAPELIAVGDPQYKFEIQVREANHNQTAVENCFNVQR
jgi:hypothetical protein